MSFRLDISDNSKPKFKIFLEMNQIAKGVCQLRPNSCNCLFTKGKSINILNIEIRIFPRTIGEPELDRVIIMSSDSALFLLMT
jgi:hypothetical protein